MNAKTKIADKITLRGEGNTPTAVSINFTHGEKVLVELDKLPEGMQRELMAHGLSQKLGDSYSSAKGDLNFAYAECSAVAESLLDGQWKRKGGGDGGDLAQALANLTGKDVGDCVQVLHGLDDEGKKQLRKRKDVKAELARIKLARLEAQAGPNTDDKNDLSQLF